MHEIYPFGYRDTKYLSIYLFLFFSTINLKCSNFLQKKAQSLIIFFITIRFNLIKMRIVLNRSISYTIIKIIYFLSLTNKYIFLIPVKILV